MTRYKVGDRVKDGGFKVGDIVEGIDDDGEFVEMRIDAITGRWGHPPSGVIIAGVEVLAEDENGLDVRVDYKADPAIALLK